MSKAFFSFLILFLIQANTLMAAGGSGSVMDLKWSIINFSILFIFLIWKLRRPMSDMFTRNAEDVLSLFNLAEEKSKEAQIKYDEYKKKVDGLEGEKERIVAEANANADKFSREHMKETDQLIEAMNTDVKNRIENERVQMSRNLNANLLDEVIGKVKMKIDSDKSLKNKASEKLMSQI